VRVGRIICRCCTRDKSTSRLGDVCDLSRDDSTLLEFVPFVLRSLPINLSSLPRVLLYLPYVCAFVLALKFLLGLLSSLFLFVGYELAACEQPVLC